MPSRAFGKISTYRLRFLFFVIAAALWLPATAHAAGYPLQIDADTYATLSFRVQAAAVLEQDQAGAANGDATKGGDHYDFFARRIQLLATGQVTSALSFMMMLEHARYGQNHSRGTGMQTADAWVQLNMSEAFHLMAGVYNPPFSRNQLTSVMYLIGPDRPILENMMLESPGLYEKRDNGACLWGNFSGLQYRFAVGKGAKSPLMGDEALRTTWRVHYAFLDPEPIYYYKESYLGKQRVFTVGYSYDKQERVTLDASGNPAPYTASTYDLSMEGGGDGSTYSILYAYYSYDWGNPERTGADGLFVQGNGWTLTAAYLSSPSQPYVRYTTWDAASVSPGAKQKRTAIGTNYFMKGHESKFTFEYETVSFDLEGSTYDMKNHGVFTIQFQAAF